MVKVYDLHDDKQLIARMQSATQQRKKPFIRTKWGLFGSPEWWTAVESNRLLHTVDGIISRVYMSGHNDYPQFELDDGSEKTQWTRHGDDALYVVGAAARIQHMDDQEIMGGCCTGSKQAIRIWIDPPNNTPEGIRQPADGLPKPSA